MVYSNPPITPEKQFKEHRGFDIYGNNDLLYIHDYDNQLIFQREKTPSGRFNLTIIIDEDNYQYSTPLKEI